MFLTSVASAASIGYVLKNSGNPDSNVINAMNDLGMTYDLIDDSDISILWKRLAKALSFSKISRYSR